MIICLGTTPTVQRTMTFEQLHVGDVNRATSVTETASGKSLNVARVLHTLGEPLVATGFVGGDSGAFIREDLSRAGIAHDFVNVGPKTRTCVTVIDEAERTATELIEESKRVEDDAFDRLGTKLAALLVGAKLLVMSGTLTPGAPPDFYARCVERANGAGVRSILDATGVPLRHALAARPIVVKPNRAELGKTLDVDTSTNEGLRDGMRRLVGEGSAWAVVTLGGEGAMVSDGQRFWRVAAPNVNVVSPIGSGDSFAAGLAAGVFRGQSVPQACALAVACGAANAMTPVAGYVRREDVERLLRDVRIVEAP
jgi:tagatose 6-phosphate kinase